jgi:hypothetical protein
MEECFEVAGVVQAIVEETPETSCRQSTGVGLGAVAIVYN